MPWMSETRSAPRPGAGRGAAPAHDVLVRGTGVVGLCAALSLARLGLRVALLGPAAPPQGDIRAYALNAASVRLLTTLKVWDALPPDARTPVQDMRIEGDAPGAALGFSAWAQRSEALAWIVDTAELESALHAAVRFAPHVQPVAAEVPAALTLLAEGRDSATRARLGVRWQGQGYGHLAIAARLRAGQPHAGLARQWFRSPDVLALLPMDRPEPGHGLALVWSLPQPRAQALLALDDAAFEAALQDATGGAAGALSLCSPRAAWPLALQRADPVCGPGWALLGDAAHLVHPLAGQGLNLGLADVDALARVIAAREPWRALGDERLLRRYARERAAPTWLMGQLTDGLLHLFAHPAPWVREARNRGLNFVDRAPLIKRMLAARALDAEATPNRTPS
jgi:2-polyprenyl-6-methoxyphenol hydroxylase-like FAD-dependent oxidoreductase